MKKRWISAGLIFVLMISLFAGCNPKEKAKLNIIDDNYRNFYEIFVYSYCDSDGDKIGDLNGVTQKLDYIQEMGFNGIWLMPIMPSTTYHKYDVIDYCDIDSQYGNIDDFKLLLDECHKRGINVIIDFVMNHSSSKNPWFLEACEYLKGLKEGQDADSSECKYVDYYNFSKEQVNSTYYKVYGSEYYYEGSFWEEMPDLKLTNPEVKKEFEDIAKFWIDLGVDGFRMDAVMHFEEGDVSTNNEILNGFYEYCKSLKPDFYMVSEVWAGETTIADYYGSKTPSMFNFDTSSAEGCLARTAMGRYSAQRFVETMVEYQDIYSAQNPDYIDAPFLTNHDQVRFANNVQSVENNMKMAAGLLLMMNGSPFVYYGEEIGMQSSGKEDENKRLPMRWSDEDTSGIPNGPSGCKKDIEYKVEALDKQLEDPDSLLNYYKRALLIRNQNPEIARGKVEIIESLTNEKQAVITKSYEDSKIAIVYNTQEENCEIDVTGSELDNCEIVASLTLLPEEEITEEASVIKMPAKSIAVLKLTGISQQ